VYRQFRSVLVGALIASAQLSAQTVETLAQIDDVVAGVGNIQSIENVAVNDNKTWLMVCDTDAPTAVNSVVLRDGLLLYREGDGVDLPVGATIEGFVDWEIDRHGNLVQHRRICDDGTILDGLYWNDRLMALEETQVGAIGLGPKVWRSFDAFRINSENQVLILGNVIDEEDIGTSVPGTNTLVLVETNPNGDVIEKKTLVVEGYTIPGLPSPIDRFPTDPGSHTIALNRQGAFLWSAITEDNVQYLMIGIESVISFTNYGFLAPDDPHLDGRRIHDFENYRGDLNDMGDFVYSCRLQALNGTELETDYLIVVNDEKLVQEGDVIDSLAGAVIDDGTEAPIFITNARHVFWQAALRNTTDAENAAFLHDDKVIVRKGQTVLDGKLVVGINSGPNAFYVSSDGRYWLGRVVLAGVGDALAYVDFGLAVPIPGRGVNQGTLEVVDGSILLGRDVTLSFDNGQIPGAFSFLFFSPTPAIPGSEFGHLKDYGELLVGLPFSFFLFGPNWNGVAAEVIESLPTDPALVDTAWYGQAAFLDFTHQSPEPIRLTNGLRIELGAP